MMMRSDAAIFLLIPMLVVSSFSMAAPSLTAPAPSLKTTLPSSTTITTQAVVTLKPEITGYAHSGCINKGSRIAINGKNFGSKKSVSLGGHGISVSLPVISWSSTKIVATIPKDNKISNDQWYYIGIKDSMTQRWLSNINKNITICKSSIKTLSTLAAPSTIMPSRINTNLPLTTKSTVTPPLAKQPSNPAPNQIPPNNREKPQTNFPDDSQEQRYADYYEHDETQGDSWEDYGGYGPEPNTSTVLPNSYGSLIDRQLPPPPPNLALAQEKRNFIEKRTEAEELVVISGDMNEARQLAQQLGGYGLSAKRRKVLKNLGLVITTFRVPKDADLQQMTLDVRQAYPSMWVDMNHRYTLLGNNRTTHFAHSLIKWTSKHKLCGKGLRIGLIDTAIEKNHPALKASKIISHSLLSPGIKPAKPDHGTAVAALLAGNGNSKTFSGLMPAAKLFAASVFRQRDKRNTDTTAEWIVSAIDWLLSQQVHTINMSIGGPRNLLVDVAIQRTIKSGVSVIAAAGNSGATASPVYPAAQPGVIAVTAVDSKMNIYRKANHGSYIDFAAPGVDIWSAKPGGSGKYMSGTSYAVPFITATMATLANKHGPRKAYQLIKDNVKDLGERGKDNQFGWGFLQTTRTCP